MRTGIFPWYHLNLSIPYDIDLYRHTITSYAPALLRALPSPPTWFPVQNAANRMYSLFFRDCLAPPGNSLHTTRKATCFCSNAFAIQLPYTDFITFFRFCQGKRIKKTKKLKFGTNSAFDIPLCIFFCGIISLIV